MTETRPQWMWILSVLSLMVARNVYDLWDKSGFYSSFFASLSSMSTVISSRPNLGAQSHS